MLTGSRLSSTLKKVDSMRWTSHMQECLQDIEAQGEDPLDGTLVQYVKIQLIAEKSMSSGARDANLEPDAGMQPPPYLFAQEMLGQLGHFRSAITHDLSQNGKFSHLLSSACRHACSTDHY